jgi:bacterioferritin (cytochrome b1)
MTNTYDIGKSRLAYSPEFEGALGTDVEQVVACLMSMLECKYSLDSAYRSFADRVRGPWRDALVEHWQEHAKDERQAAYDLSMKIMGFGFDPNLVNYSTPSVPSDLDSFCAALIQLELKVISEGRRLIEMAGDHTSLKVLGENIVLLDTHHLDDLRRMCGIEK